MIIRRWLGRLVDERFDWLIVLSVVHRTYLQDLAETTHEFLKMLEEHTSKLKHVFVQRRRTARKSSKKSKKKKKQEETSGSNFCFTKKQRLTFNLPFLFKRKIPNHRMNNWKNNGKMKLPSVYLHCCKVLKRQQSTNPMFAHSMHFRMSQLMIKGLYFFFQ